VEAQYFACTLADLDPVLPVAGMSEVSEYARDKGEKVATSTELSGKAWGRWGRVIKTAEDLEVLPGVFGHTGELSGRPRGRGRALTRTARHGDTYSDGDIELNGGLVQASYKENGGLVRGCRPLRRRRRQREGGRVCSVPNGVPSSAVLRFGSSWEGAIGAEAHCGVEYKGLGVCV
jgi:hypothetical protein